MNTIADAWLFIFNFVAGLAVAWICLCRLNVMNRFTMLRFRMKYTLLMTAALTLGGLPFLFEVRHNVLTLIGLTLALVLLLLEVQHWRHGPPSNSYRHQRF